MMAMMHHKYLPWTERSVEPSNSADLWKNIIMNWETCGKKIDYRRSNLMTHPEEIEKFNKICEGTESVFLDGLEDPLDRVRADVV
jgi:hypothetical protein